LAVAFVMLVAAGSALALANKDVVGKWGLDEAKSKAATDGNTAGLMAEVTIKADGTFEAMYGTKGTWKIGGGKLLVTFDTNKGFRKDEEAKMDGEFLKFPAPAMAGKFCYLKKK
jgi:hypothetical protein